MVWLPLLLWALGQCSSCGAEAAGRWALRWYGDLQDLQLRCHGQSKLGGQTVQPGAASSDAAQPAASRLAFHLCSMCMVCTLSTTWR